MKVAFLDLTYTYFYESYSCVNASRYGGWKNLIAHLKQFPNYYIIADKRCFDEITDKENKDNLIEINEKQRAAIKAGAPLVAILPFIKEIDLLITCHVGEYYNFQGLDKIRVAALDFGVYQNIHPNYKYIIQYSKEQFSNISNKEAKIYYFQLGINIPQYHIKDKREDFLFSCSRICPLMSSIEVANFCKVYKIKGYFAGPVADDYKFLECVDNKYVYYLGEISDNVKNNYYKRARLSSQLINWASPFSLSAIESLANGCPIVVTPNGNWWPTLIKDGVNGFYARNNDELYAAWQKSKDIDSRECYKSVLKYNHLTMLDEFFGIMEKIHNN